MCILCVVQRWSRAVATMLPWLVIPLILLWAVSQFFPPALRFEITSPRLACVLVLLVTLFWYEILMPQVVIWRTRRSARLREWHRAQALELLKLRKTATRRCRNCLTPYRDQNPGGGRFMCSYCGHISKRPVLDLPGPVKNSGIITDLIRKNGWICSQDWLSEGNGNWVSTRYLVGDDRCSTQKSYSGVLFFVCKLLSCFFSSVRWLCRKVFRFSLQEDDSSDADHRGSSSKRDIIGNSVESKSEKARRKAEEKRQARLEKEMLEEEERKQREEVARLVEERRKLRDEKLEAEREHLKGAALSGEKEHRKESEKRRPDKRNDKDKGSNKSTSDGEDCEKRISRESERKRDFDRKSENEKRDSLKAVADTYKSHHSEGSHGNKVVTSKPRYFDRVTGSFLSSSKGFTGASFFGRHTQNSTASFNKTTKQTVGFTDHGSGSKRDSQVAGSTTAKAASNGDDRRSTSNIHQPVGLNVHQQPGASKKSWHQLFIRSTPVSPYPDTNTLSYQSQNAQNANFTDQRLLPNYSFNQLNTEQVLPLSAYPPLNGAFSTSPRSHLSPASMLSSVKEPGPIVTTEEAEIFEDPCNLPCPISLPVSVSESLDIPLDLGAGFVSDDNIEVPSVLKNLSAPGEISKPSPIESPMSKLRIAEDKQTASGQFQHNSSTGESYTSKLDESSNEQGWQLWGTPVVQKALGLDVGSRSWLSSIRQNKFKEDDIMHHLPHNSMAVAKESLTLPGILSPNVHVGNLQNDGIYNPMGHAINDNDLWMSKFPFQSSPGDGESHLLPLSLMDNIQGTDVRHDTPERSMINNPFEKSPVNSWAKKEWSLNGKQEVGTSLPAAPHIGGLFSTGPDVQSVWSFSKKETI